MHRRFKHRRQYQSIVIGPNRTVLVPPMAFHIFNNAATLTSLLEIVSAPLQTAAAVAAPNKTDGSKCIATSNTGSSINLSFSEQIGWWRYIPCSRHIWLSRSAIALGRHIWSSRLLATFDCCIWLLHSVVAFDHHIRSLHSFVVFACRVCSPHSIDAFARCIHSVAFKHHIRSSHSIITFDSRI